MNLPIAIPFAVNNLSIGTTLFATVSCSSRDLFFHRCSVRHLCIGQRQWRIMQKSKRDRREKKTIEVKVYHTYRFLCLLNQQLVFALVFCFCRSCLRKIAIFASRFESSKIERKISPKKKKRKKTNGSKKSERNCFCTPVKIIFQLPVH